MVKKIKKNSDETSSETALCLEDVLLKEFAGEIMTLNNDVASSVDEWISSGSYRLDKIISNFRGLPVRRMVSIIGKKSSGKSTIVASIIKSAQKVGALCVLFDTEFTFDKERAAKIGINCDNLLITQPDTTEECFNKLEKIVEKATGSGRLILLVWDSVAATPTVKELEGEMGEGGHYGEHSKVLSQGFRKIMKTVSSERMLLVTVNQIKTNINATYGDQDTYIGKNPIDFHSSVMLNVKQISVEKDNKDIPYAITSEVKVSKNKVGPPFKTATLRINFADGIDTGWEALQIAMEEGRVRMAGAWREIVLPCKACMNKEEVNRYTKTVKVVSSGKVDGKKCETCNGECVISRPEFKKFYESDIHNVLDNYPGLEEWFVYGTGVYAPE